MIKSAKDRKRVVLIDDDKSVTQMLSLLLTTRGYEVSVANTGKEAFNVVSEGTDLIILDLILPDQDGFEICRKLRESKETRHIPIVILTAKVLSEDIIEALYTGADDYLIKPFDCEELIARMEAVMRRSTLIGRGKSMSKQEQDIIKELRLILDERRITTHFQPIYYLEPLRLFGVEALCRPETNTVLAAPEVLFKAAMEYGLYQDIEMLAWEKTLAAASQFLTDEKLFLNCNPYLIESPTFLLIKSLFDKNTINVKNVILEITERSAISEFKIFYEHLRQYRDYGFQFAIDDVGGGYASLESIVETKPEVVKIDRHIIRDLNKDRFKRSIVKFIVAFCRENGILSIAEGIETKDDLYIVMELGVDAGQGYYFQRPTPDVDLQKMSQLKNII